MSEKSINLEKNQLRLLHMLRLIFIVISIPLAVLTNALYSINELKFIINPSPVTLYGQDLSDPFVQFLAWIWTNTSTAQIITIALLIGIIVVALSSVFIRDWSLHTSKNKINLGIMTELLIFSTIIIANFSFFRLENSIFNPLNIVISLTVLVTIFTLFLAPVGLFNGLGNWEIWSLILVNCMIAIVYMVLIMPVDFIFNNVVNIVGFRLIYFNLPLILMISMFPAYDRLTYRQEHSHWTAVAGLSIPIVTYTVIIFVFGSIFHFSLANRWLESKPSRSEQYEKQIQVLKVNPDGVSSSEKVTADLLIINNINLKEMSDKPLTPELHQAQAEMFLKAPLDKQDYQFVMSQTKIKPDPVYDLAFVSHKPLFDDPVTFEQVLKVQTRLKQYKDFFPKNLEELDLDQKVSLEFDNNDYGEIDISVLDEEGFRLPDFIVGLRKSKENLTDGNSMKKLPAINFCVLDNSGKATFKNIPIGRYEVFLVTEPKVHPLLEMFEIKVESDILDVSKNEIKTVKFQLIPKV